MTIDAIKSREEAVAYLDGYVQERKEELDEQRTTRPLVKSYMLETVARDKQLPSIEEIFEGAGHVLTSIDDGMYKVHSKQEGRPIGFLENLLHRHPVFYTCEKVTDADGWVKNMVRSSLWLDHLWLSGRTFEQLLKIVLQFSPEFRYGRLVFEHENYYQSGYSVVSEPAEDNGDDEPMPFSRDDEDKYVPERRKTRFEIIERLGKLKSILPEMKNIYSPLHAVSQIRFPARGRGGHDFYHNGKVTNRSDSFADHRQHIIFVLRIYKHATEKTEQLIWQRSLSEPAVVKSHGEQFSGAPVLLEFSEVLDQDTFDRFITMTFGRKHSRFRLWGNPISLGPRKVHVYGMDQHLWQPIFLEITAKHIVAIVPEGTCGNSVHRLVTNVQQYLDPAVNAFVGDKPYAELIAVDPDVKGIYDASN